MNFQRCVTCGKSLEIGDDVVRIVKGAWTERQVFDEQEEFGFLHADCFQRSVESPVTAMQEIKKLAKAATRVIAPPKSKRAPKRIMVKPAEPKLVASVVDAPPRRKRGRPPKNAAAVSTNAIPTSAAKHRRG